ncbi:MAG: ComEC/Rec2 family competence protein, partial [Firmicutes bacterium]|nr:ComEC/Rec2 family competence protein [Bacillota bacterium]
LRGKWYDGLNSLGFAACVLLLFDPFLLFSTSFLLSFGSVLGINLFYKSINRWLQTIIDKKLTFNTSEFSKKSNIIPKYTTRTIKNTASGLAMGLSVQATTVALTALLLHRIATYSIVANLVLKPLLGIVFIGLMLLVPIVYIVPFMGWALQLFDIVLVALLSLLNWIADLPYSNIFIWPGLPFVLALMIGLVSCSRFVLYRRTRLVSGVVSVLLYLSIFVVGLPQNKLNNVIVPMSNNQTIVISNNETMYFGNIGAKASESYGVLNFKISKIHTLFVTDIFVNASSLRAMRRSFGIEEFFVPPTISINDILSMEKAGLNFSIMDEQVMTDHGQFSIGCIMLDNVFMGYQLLGGNVNILISAQDMPLYKFDEDILHNFDILRGANTVAYNDALQIVDYSFFDVYTDNVLVAYDRQRAYFDFVEWVIRE